VHLDASGKGQKKPKQDPPNSGNKRHFCGRPAKQDSSDLRLFVGDSDHGEVRAEPHLQLEQEPIAGIAALSVDGQRQDRAATEALAIAGVAMAPRNVSDNSRQGENMAPTINELFEAETFTGTTTGAASALASLVAAAAEAQRVEHAEAIAVTAVTARTTAPPASIPAGTVTLSVRSSGQQGQAIEKGKRGRKPKDRPGTQTALILYLFVI
jgi:hypothetical protein